MEQNRFFKKLLFCSALIWVVILMIGVGAVQLFSAETALVIVLVVLTVALVFGALYYSKARRKINSELLQSVAVDDLTGLPTKQQHKIEATQILKESNENFAYVSCDIVDFKFFNETYGYAYGNIALKNIASVLLKEMKKNELISRTTGDHFCMMLSYTKVEALEERILKMMEKVSDFPTDDNGGMHKAVFRCGVYLIRKEDDINMVRSRANMARKTITKSLSTRINLYSEEDLAKELERKELEEEIRSAVERKELVVYFQPKFDIASEKVIGAEALVRWNHPTKGMLPPGIFIPLCEENGFICTLDFYMLEEVCKQMKQWKEVGKQLIKVSVNFSRLHLSNKGFVDKLVEVVRSYGLEPKNLEIELTETVAYEEMENLLAVMHQIKEAGFGLSMDDFGSGYSSLNLLREMPVDVLKLDKGFLDDCGGNDSTREKRIISHVISMAKDLEISVLAEGVETMQQKEFLRESNCDMIQGYYYAKPMPTDKFVNYLEAVSA
ncbi:MAG: EAL domain-containing protein [Lachnospiraceae bacterium]|nr:EAL domain-containing protein [Lachnospiraceae bacterium]